MRSSGATGWPSTWASGPAAITVLQMESTISAQIVGTGTVAGDNLDHALMWRAEDGSPTPTPTPTATATPRPTPSIQSIDEAHRPVAKGDFGVLATTPCISAQCLDRDTRARGRFQRVLIAIYVGEAPSIIKWEQGD